jgi:capsular polysaccharide biosynthesis protein
MNFKKIISLVFFAFAAVCAYAQTDEVPMADTMRSNGKIYVVLAIVLVILSGIIFYLVSLDKKIKKLEDENKTK